MASAQTRERAKTPATFPDHRDLVPRYPSLECSAPLPPLPPLSLSLSHALKKHRGAERRAMLCSRPSFHVPRCAFPSAFRVPPSPPPPPTHPLHMTHRGSQA